MESIKQEAKRPKPPFPKDGSGSISSIWLNDLPTLSNSALIS